MSLFGRMVSDAERSTMGKEQQIKDWENEFDKKFPDIISLGALQEIDMPDLEFSIKDFIKELLKARR